MQTLKEDEIEYTRKALFCKETRLTDSTQQPKTPREWLFACAPKTITQKIKTPTESRNDDVDGNDSGDKIRGTKHAKLHLSFSKQFKSRDEGSVSTCGAISQVSSDKRQMSVVYRQFGMDPSVLDVEYSDSFPKLKSAYDVIIKVQASTVSIADCLMRRGVCFDLINPISLPVTPGQDVVGHIVICGDKVDLVKVGDRVAALVRNGGNTRYISVHQNSLVKVPRRVDAAEAATMVSVYTAAYQTLKNLSQPAHTFSLENKKILVVGGMDPVAQALIQMCLKAKAVVYATAPTRRHAYIQNVLGATPLPENTVEWLPHVHNRMDYVFDGVCEDGLERSCKALNSKGELICFGNSSLLKEKDFALFGAPITAHVNRILSQTKFRTKTIDIWESFEKDPETYKKNLRSLFHLLKWNKIKPHIARRVALSEVADAHAKLEQNDFRGIVVCLPWKRLGPKGYREPAEQ